MVLAFSGLKIVELLKVCMKKNPFKMYLKPEDELSKSVEFLG